MVFRRRKDVQTSVHPTKGASTWDDVQEFGGEPFQSSKADTPSDLASYHIVSRSELNTQTSESSSTTAAPDHATSLHTLPAELILAIAQHLQYPDLLALRHTHPRFLNTKLLSTADRLYKVLWIVDRRERGLPVPMNKTTRLDSDAAFCSQAEVRAIMQRRLRHGECAPGPAGCMLVDGRECGGPRDSLLAARGGLRAGTKWVGGLLRDPRAGVVLLGFLGAVVGVAFVLVARWSLGWAE